MLVAIAGEDWDVVDLIEQLPDLQIAGFFAPTLVHAGLFRHLGNDEAWIGQSGLKVVLAVDIPSVRARLFDHYGAESIYTLKSPQAHISKWADISKGSIIQRDVVLMPHVKLGICCKVNVNAKIHHDAKVGNFCTIAPGALILGNVTVEDQVYIGAGATIKQRCHIGKGAFVGAGAVVVQDVPAGQTVVGVPAASIIR